MKRRKRRLVSHLKVRDLLKEWMANVDPLAKQVKLRVAAIVSDQEQKKLMHIALDHLKLRNVKIHLAQTPYLGRNGSVRAQRVSHN